MVFVDVVVAIAIAEVAFEADSFVPAIVVLEVVVAALRLEHVQPVRPAVRRVRYFVLVVDLGFVAAAVAAAVSQ